MRALFLLLTCLLVASPAVAQLALTPSQTEGPYYPVARLKPVETDSDLTRVGSANAKGAVVVVKGIVVDPSGQPIEGARVEIWQTDNQGIYLHPGDSNVGRRDKGFQFYGEAKSDAAGAVTFRTIIPSRYPGRARHIHVKVTPPGGSTLTTQLYFAGDSDLGRDGPARSLGKALADVTLTPKPAADGASEATVRLVVRRGKGA